MKHKIAILSVLSAASLLQLSYMRCPCQDRKPEENPNKKWETYQLENPSLKDLHIAAAKCTDCPKEDIEEEEEAS